MKKKAKKRGRRWDRDGGRWDIDSEWEGTAMIYVACGTASFALSGDYYVSYEDESNPDDMRAVRLYRTSPNSDVPELPADKLADEMAIIFGAKVTASNAVKTLKSLISRIEDEGLIIGRIKHGDYVKEPVDRDLTASNARLFPVSD